MPRKKPSPVPSTATTMPPPAQYKKTGGPMTNPRPQADNRWQRTKRYGWDSR